VSDLIAFMNARLDETEARALAAREDWDDESQRYEWNDLSEAVFAHARCLDPELVLREVEAKRKILTRYSLLLAEQEDRDAGLDGVGGLGVHGAVTALRPCVIALAAVYSDHPDYDDPWVPGSRPGRPTRSEHMEAPMTKITDSPDGSPEHSESPSGALLREPCGAKADNIRAVCELPTGHVRDIDDWHEADAESSQHTKTNAFEHTTITREHFRWRPNLFELPKDQPPKDQMTKAFSQMKKALAGKDGEE